MERHDMMQVGLSRIIEGQHLSRTEARSVMEQIMSGSATQAQIGGLLTALRLKGETVDEITGFAEAMRSYASPVQAEEGSGRLLTHVEPRFRDSQV